MADKNQSVTTLASSIGLKEWAAVCQALRNGRQSLLLRKGGIEEKGNEFRIDYPEFWLVPTRFHQSSEEIIPEEHDLLEICCSQRPKENEIKLSEFATVEEIHFLKDEDKLSRLRDFHILSDETVLNRFYYKFPGIYLVVVRIYQLESPIILPKDPSYEGCKSWIELPETISAENAAPALPDDSYQEFRKKFESSLFGKSSV